MNKKVSEWYKRHKELKIKENWTKQEYDIVLDNIIYEKIENLNELVLKLNNKTIYDLVNLLQNDLKIGNKPLKVLLYCSYCKKKDYKKYE